MFKKGFFIFALTIFALTSSLFFAVPKVSAAPSDYQYSIIYQSPYPSTTPNEITKLSLQIKNTGSETWVNNGANPLRLGTGSSYGISYQIKDYTSEVVNNDWISANRPVSITESEVIPGQTAGFNFNIKAPSIEGKYKIYFTPVVDGITWMKDMGIYWEITVKNDQPININQTITKTESVENGLKNQLAPSVVKLTCKFNDSFSNQGSGTLFFNSSLDPRFPDFYILTNEHVVKTENSSPSMCDIQLFPNHQTNQYLTYQSIGYEKLGINTDFAIIKPQLSINDIHAGTINDLTKYALKNNSDAKIGPDENLINDKIYVFGYPKNGDLTMSEGSFLNYESYNSAQFIDTSAPLDRGNSGGLAVNSNGTMLGIPTFVRGNVGMILDTNYLFSKLN